MGFIHFYYITYKRFLELLYCPKLLIFQCSLHINYVRKLIKLSNKKFNYEPEDYKALMAQSIKDDNDLENIVLENLNILDNFLK